MKKKVVKLPKRVIKKADKIIKELNENHKYFCHEYTLDWNATRAYQKVYNSSYEVAMASGCRLLRNDKIQEYINFLKENIEINLGLSKQKIIKEHLKLAFSSIAHMHNTWIERKEFDELTDEQKECIEEISTQTKTTNNDYGTTEVEFVKIKLYSKQDSLKEISKLMGYNAPEKSEIKVEQCVIELPEQHFKEQKPE